MENAPFVGLWSQYPKSGNYICIEPWWGIADTLDSDGQLEHKRGMNHIAPNEVWENGFTMAFHDKACLLYTSSEGPNELIAAGAYPRVNADFRNLL